MTTRRIDELMLEMEALSLKVDDLDPKHKGVKKVMVERLREFYLEENYGGNIPETLKQVLEFESPMLCFRFKDLKESEQEDVLGGKDWIAEEKFNGVRCLVSFHEHEGFRFFSRHTSVHDYFPVNLTHAVPILFDNDEGDSEYHFGHSVRIDMKSFVIDAELVCSVQHLKVGKEVSTSPLSAMVALCNADTNLAKEVFKREWEKKQEALVEINVFDLLMLNGEAWTEEVYLRRKKEIKDSLEGHITISSSFRVVPIVVSNRLQFYQSLLKEKKEGVVLKNIYAPYYADTGRKRLGWVKMKRSMTGAVLEDLDVWIEGWEPATEGKRHEGKVGTLLLYTHLVKKDGSREEYHIASVGNMPDKLREEMTGSDGYQFGLNTEYINKVISIDGMSISPKNRRITHAVVNWDNCWKDMKTPDMCELEEEVLEKNII